MAKKKYVLALFLALMACVCLLLAACKGSPGDDPVSGDEVGIYYNDGFGSEYMISLKEKCEVDFQVEDVDATGTYTLDGTKLTLSLEGQEEIEATFADRTITLTYNGKQMAFIEKIQYTVTFQTNGGSSISPVKVINGKTLSKPADPTRKNYKFLNWYGDKVLKTLFDFESQTITENITLYAKWEYVPIENTLTYDNADVSTEKPTAAVTESQDFVLEVPVRKDGDSVETFVGWFTAEDGRGEQLTDETGASLAPWDARGDIKIYPYFVLPLDYALLDDGTYEVSGSEATESLSELVIPAYYKNAAVTRVGSFDGHKALVRVTIPATVTQLLETAFNESPLIEEFVVSEVEGVSPTFETDGGILYTDNKNTLVKYPIARKGNGAPETSFTVPAYVTKIAPYAFADVLKKSNGDYEPGEFYGTLTEIVFPDNLIEVGDYAFFERQAIQTITFGMNPAAGVELTIGEYAFAYTTTTTGLTLPKNLVELKAGAFAGDTKFVYWGKLEGEGPLVLPDGLKTIGDKAFEYNVWITSITFPASITAIGANAFANCGTYFDASYNYKGGLKSVAFAEGSQLTTVSEGAFSWDTELTSVVLPSSLRYLGDSAFSGCSKLTEIELPQGIVSIGDSLFNGCRELISVNVPSSVTSFGSGVFGGCSKLTLENIDIPDDSLVLSKDERAIFNKEKTSLILYPVSNMDVSYEIPGTVTRIEPYAFQNNEYLESVSFPKGLSYIGESAFYKCIKLQSVVIPEGVTVINTSTFEGCDALAYVYIPASVKEIGASAFGGKTWTVTLQLVVEFAENSELTAIGDEAFDGCNIASIELPESLISIGERAFSGNDFETIVIPDNVQILGDYAFLGCTNLKSAVLPVNLTSVGMAPFWGANALETLELSEEAANFAVIENNLYSKDGTVLVQYACGKKDTVFEIPESVTEIGAYAMAGAPNLTEVRVTENVATVGIMAWHAGNVKTYVIDSQDFINLFTNYEPTDMGYEIETIYVREDIVIPPTATYFDQSLEKVESDRDGYVKYVVK